MKFWRSDNAVHAHLRFGRFQFGYHVYRHHYATAPPRFVFQPFAIYDCRKAA